MAKTQPYKHTDFPLYIHIFIIEIRHRSYQCTAWEKYYWSSAFNSLRKQFFDCIDQAECVGTCMIDCMLEYTEFGIPCAGCFGQFATCAGQYCFGEPHDYCYYGPDDPTWGWVCKRCLTHVSPCQDEFRPCSGFPFFLGE